MVLTVLPIRPRNINQALCLLLALVIVPLVLGATILLIVQWRLERELLQKQLTALAQSLVQTVEGELDYGRGQLEAIGASPVIDAQDWQQVHRFAVEVTKRRPDIHIALVSADGQVLLNSAVPWGEPLHNLWTMGQETREMLWQGRTLPLSSQALIRRVFERGQVTYSDLYYGMLLRQPRLALAVPVLRNGQVRYALMLTYPPADLQALIRSVVNAPGLRALIEDRNGIVVASSADAAVRLGDKAYAISIAPGSTTGYYELRARDGTGVFGAYAVSPSTGFVVRASIERGFWPGRATSAGWLALMLLALASSILLAGFFGRRLARPLRELGQWVQEGQRSLGGVGSSSIAEIDALARALRAGVEAERERSEERALRVAAQQGEELVKRSEDRLKRVLDQLFASVAVLDLDGLVLECNEVSLRRAGVQRSSVIGKPFWECPWWLHDGTVSQQVRQAAQRAAQGETVRFDSYGKFARGELLMQDVQLSPLHDDAGRITHLIASCVDVEARVKALRELERSEARSVESARRLDQAHRMLQATLEAAPIGIAVTDPRCQLLQINQAGAELLGIASAVDRNLAFQSLRGWRHKSGVHEAHPLLPDQWPLQRAIGEHRVVTSIIDVAPADGAERRRTVLMSAAPVLDATGALMAAVVAQVDISKRVAAEAALRRADRQKDEFLATLAHELRNPLAPIRTAVELIRRRNPADSTVQRARAVIERQVTHLSRLVDDLLDVSRVTLGTIELRQAPLDLGAVATEAAESISASVETAGLTLEHRIDHPSPQVHGDAVRLSQCILNLLNNAVKFTPRGGHIVLRVGQDGPMAFVEVTDDGIGISRANLERIFELFVQERPSGFHGSTGLGIGLALTRKLVELHGGTVRASSAGPDCGSTFRVELPAWAAAAGLPPPRGAASHGGGARVLLVDDNRDAAETLGEMLSMSGFAISIEYDGEAALRAMAHGAPDAVLLDIGLPDIDGYEVCRRIRRLQLSKQPLVIALTGWGQDKDRDRATAAGFNAHLTKPVDSDRLVRLLQELLNAAEGSTEQ